MSSTAQQFDFQAPKEQVLGILKNIAQAGLRIDYVGTKELPGPVTRVNLHHRMTAMTWGDSIAIYLLSNEVGSTHMNIVSSNSNAFTFGLHSKNISAIAQYVKREIEKSSPRQSKADAMGELARLKKLLDLGVISEEEFQSKKEKLLKLL